MSTTQAQLVSDPLEICSRDFFHAMDDARNLLTYESDEALHSAPSSSAWSALECVVHLNLATQAMLPGIREAVEAAPAKSAAGQTLKMDLPGRLLAWSLEPPALIKLKAPKLAQPFESDRPEAVLREFEQ